MTALDLISSSLRLIGVLASGETASAAEASDGLMILNQMLDSWSAEKLMIFTNTRQVLTPASLVQSYTLGTGGVFNYPRPPQIDAMGIQVLTNPAQPIEFPLQMVNDTEWAQIQIKNLTGTTPRIVWDDGGFPLRTLSFWPIPSVQVNFVLYAWTALNQFANLTTDYTFPPGYLKALRYNLAADLAPEFGAQLSAEVALQAISSKAVVKDMNVQPMTLACDSAVLTRGFYDWRTDRIV